MKTITAEELKARIDAGEQLNIVDVREPHENWRYIVSTRPHFINGCR
jgi:hypothetical protein